MIDIATYRLNRPRGRFSEKCGDHYIPQPYPSNGSLSGKRSIKGTSSNEIERTEEDGVRMGVAAQTEEGGGRGWAARTEDWSKLMGTEAGQSSYCACF